MIDFDSPPLRDRRPQRAADQRQPDAQADEQEDLPEAAEVDVFPALVAEPEVLRQAELLHHRQPLAGERADDDDEEADEQDVDAEALVLRLVSGDRRADVQAHAQPRGRDPQHRELRVPGAGQGVGQDVGELEAVGLLAFDLVVRGDRAEQDLREEQRDHQPEVLRGGAHRRRDADHGQRIAGGQRRRRLVLVTRVVPAEQRDAGDQEQHAEHRPHEQVRRRRVADQRLVRPVVRVGDVARRGVR